MIAALIRWSARNVFVIGFATIFVTLAGIYAEKGPPGSSPLSPRSMRVRVLRRTDTIVMRLSCSRINPAPRWSRRPRMGSREAEPDDHAERGPARADSDVVKALTRQLPLPSTRCTSLKRGANDGIE